MLKPLIEFYTLRMDSQDSFIKKEAYKYLIDFLRTLDLEPNRHSIIQLV
jgi:hypothetical protein